MDERLTNLSYSSLLTLHSCPRKFQLNRLKATEDEANPESTMNQNVTFAFGHIVGSGIQGVMRGDSEDKIYFDMFLGWHANLEDRNEKQKKSFWLAMAAISKFLHMRESGFINDYELLEYSGKSAIELSFKIKFPDGFKFRGFVDAILTHKDTREVIVLECKTTSSQVNPASYKNSAQGVGYSVVLDVICPEVSSYKVLYLVYETKSMSFEILQFAKNSIQRVTWIQELLLDIEVIKMYESIEVYPMRGESCFTWYRECEYFNQCTLDTKYLIKPYDKELMEDNTVYEIELSLSDLLEGQIGNKSSRAECDERELSEGIINITEEDEFL